MLYSKPDYLKENVLYFDMDSIIYVDDATKNVKTDDMLGDITDEISGKGNINFVSTGPKSYSFKYGDNQQKSAINPISAWGGEWNPPPRGFSLAIALNVNQSTSNFLTFKIYYRDII